MVQPAICDFYHTRHRNAGLGARAAAAALERAGRSVDVVVASARRGKPRHLHLPKAFSHLIPYLLADESGPTSFFRRYQRFGPDPQTLAGEILQRRPEEVYISLFAWAYAEEAVDLARALRRRQEGGNLRIVLGGAGASIWPQYFDGTLPETVCGCARELFDEVVVGEAEEYLGGTAEAPGSQHVSAGHEPTWAVVHENRDSVTVALSITRGCPRRCRFCANHLAHGRSFRLPSQQAVHATVEAIGRVAAGKRLRLNIEDDNILYAPQLLLEVVQRVWSHAGAVEFSCENGLDYRLLDESLAAKLAAFGLGRINISLGDLAGDRPLDDLTNVLDLARRLGIDAVTYFIAGMPGAGIPPGEVLCALAALPTIIGVSPYYPVRGLADAPSDDVLASISPALTSGSACYPWGSLSTGQLVTTFRAARCINAVKANPGSEVAQAILSKRKVLACDKNGRLFAPPQIDKEIEKQAFLDGINYN